MNVSEQGFGVIINKAALDDPIKQLGEAPNSLHYLGIPVSEPT